MGKKTADNLWVMANEEPKKFMELISDYSQMESRLRCRLVPHETYLEYAEAGPYRKHLMGDVVLFLCAGEKDGLNFHLHVNHKMAQKWGKSEKELMDTALKNTQRYEKYILKDVNEVLKECNREDSHTFQRPVYMLSNKTGEYGATVVMYPGILKEIRQQVGMDYYVAPTTVHNLIIIPKYPFLLPKDIEDIVQKDNREVMRKEEVLSDHLFEYTKAKGRMERCSTKTKEQTQKEECR